MPPPPILATGNCGAYRKQGSVAITGPDHTGAELPGVSKLGGLPTAPAASCSKGVNRAATGFCFPLTAAAHVSL